MKENNLFEPFEIGESVLKNRFLVAPMTRASAEIDGTPTLAMQEYYEAMAKGGFAAIITEGTYTDNLNSKALPYQPGIFTSKQIDGWKKIAYRIHLHGSIAISQLMHGGALSIGCVQAIGPSSIQPKGKKMDKGGVASDLYNVPKEMDEEDINNVKAGFLAAAKAAMKAGFDGVEIHAANGYLLDQFITPETNTRNDEYGGCMENRFRIIQEIFSEIKAAVEPGFIVGLRISESKVNDLSYRWPNGADFAKQLFTEVAKYDFSYIHIAAEGGNWERECLYTNGTSSNSIARQLTKIPVIANGGLHDLQKAKALIETGHADLISIGRAAIADPEWVNKARQFSIPRPFQKGMINPLFTLENTRKYFAEISEKKDNNILVTIFSV